MKLNYATARYFLQGITNTNYCMLLPCVLEQKSVTLFIENNTKTIFQPDKVDTVYLIFA